ncbi:hypothetical protein EDC30_111105 [Paucimonas lemoignei]|uniref:Uncharacterized protein n=1 Tax=Paucimonas lemoignei TaxID=29443 RepID=A0A4R3HRC1_PAULE|nr:hypothetical protein [Paucimonas lemoignei]TCS35190.1 hypothetical protein EDC30_111105 [Paucimonas lemoignei]
MSSIENNNEDWREIRSRVDSIANAVFLVAGGALSLSISVILDKKTEPFITPNVARLASEAWYFMLASVILFLLVKAHLVFQAFMLQVKTDFVSRRLAWFNSVGWILGAIGFGCFAWGFIQMVRAAAIAVGVRL